MKQDFHWEVSDITFSCTKKECIKNHRENDTDIRLMLTIRESTYEQYYINPDGSLEYYDSDGDGQEQIIKCPACGTEYEFKYHIGYIPEQRTLPLKHEDVTIIRKRP